MNKLELIAKVAETAKVKKKEAAAIIEATLAVIKQELNQGGKVQLLGFGSFEPRKRAPRTARNPKTGEVIHIKERVVPIFKAGKHFKEAVKKEEGHHHHK